MMMMTDIKEKVSRINERIETYRTLLNQFAVNCPFKSVDDHIAMNTFILDQIAKLEGERTQLDDLIEAENFFFSRGLASADDGFKIALMRIINESLPVGDRRGRPAGHPPGSTI